MLKLLEKYIQVVNFFAFILILTIFIALSLRITKIESSITTDEDYVPNLVQFQPNKIF